MRGATEHDDVVDLLPAYVNGSLDEQQARAVTEHLAWCAACQAARDEWDAIGIAANAAARRSAPSPLVLDRVWDKLAGGRAEQPSSHRSWLERIRAMVHVDRLDRRDVVKVAAAAVAIAALVAASIVTPIGSYAQSFLDIFQPKQVVAVPVTLEDVRNLAELSRYGTLAMPADRAEIKPVADAIAAARAAGFEVVTPTWLPAGVPTAAQYAVVPGQRVSFTFSAAKAQAAAASTGEPIPPLPANLDGSTLTVTTGNAVIAIYGGSFPAVAGGETARMINQAAVRQQPPVLSGTALAERDAVRVERLPQGARLPKLIIGQAQAPTVTSTGVTADELKQYLLSLPGISPQLASALRAIGDPSSILPIPVPVNQATSHPVQVQGVTGLAIADSTGLGSVIIWTKDGMVYGVAGSLTENEALRIANSLQ